MSPFSQCILLCKLTCIRIQEELTQRSGFVLLVDLTEVSLDQFRHFGIQNLRRVIDIMQVRVGFYKSFRI